MTNSINPQEQITRLKSQVRWILQISSALAAKSTLDDIIAMLMAGLVSPNGLGYSRVLFFDHDRDSQNLKGRYALYHESLESMADLRKELEEEDAFIERRRDALMETPVADAEVADEELNSLRKGAQWVTLVQRLNLENPATELISRLSFATASPNRHAAREGLFTDIHTWRGPRALSRARLGSRLPPALAAILPEHFAVAPLNTSRGLRAVAIVDRHLEGNQPIDCEDLTQLEWFTSQAALTLENHEVTADLSHAYQELKQLDQTKSNFLSIISHELRTPLTSMSGFVDLILDQRVGEINENQRMLLTRVAKNTGHLIHLVNDLIEVAEIEAEGTVAVRMGPVEPLSVLMDTLPKLEQRRREKHVAIIPQLECQMPVITADERALGRIFFHLLDNAIKFSNEEAQVIVRFRIEDGELRISFEDRGVGIAPENLRLIFTQFYQVDNTLTRGHEGLGLGLSVTKMLVHATRGRILVESEVGRGSTFTVCYPIHGI
jgi:signal transduction histidine kinase